MKKLSISLAFIGTVMISTAQAEILEGGRLPAARKLVASHNSEDARSRL